MTSLQKIRGLPIVQTVWNVCVYLPQEYFNIFSKQIACISKDNFYVIYLFFSGCCCSCNFFHYEMSRFHKEYFLVCAQSLSHVQLFATSGIETHQAPLSMEFLRQEYWSGLLFPTPGHISDPGIETASLVSPALAGRFFNTEPPVFTWNFFKVMLLPKITLLPMN